MRGGRRVLEWNCTTEMGAALIFRGPQGWGEPGLQRGGVVYLLGKAGLTEATTKQSIVSLPASVGCDGTESMVPWIRVHMRKELSFYLTFFTGMF